jgi:hypothetical protein
LAANANVDVFEASLPHLNLKFGVAPSEVPCAMGGACAGTTAGGGGQTNPFHFQLQSGGTSDGTFSVWQDAFFDPGSQTWNPVQIPEGNNAPFLWPVVILSKLVDSTPVAPDGSLHPEDPASLTAQGSAGQPVVIIQGITLLNPSQPAPSGIGSAGQPDTLYNTVLGEGSNQLLAGAEGTPYTPFDPSCSTPACPGPAPACPTICSNGALFNYQTGQPTVIQQDHLTVAVRPAVICLAHLFDNPVKADTRGTLVTPFSGGPQATFMPTSPPPVGPIVPVDILSNGDLKNRYQVTNLVNNVQFGCLPKGRYAINVVYPDGQAWTVPNETGACSGDEGTTNYCGLTCNLKPRPILYSQGNRAVVEIVGPTNPANCQAPGPAANPTFDANTIPSGQAAPSVPVECLPRCCQFPSTDPACVGQAPIACPGPDNCSTVNDPNTGNPAQVCLPP